MPDCSNDSDVIRPYGEPADFAWPEPLLIEVLRDAYLQTHTMSDATAAARIHVRFLERLMKAESRNAAVLRLDLIALCAARAIAVSKIEAADALAFLELNKIVERRFRHSPRARLDMMRQLVDAVRRLPERTPIPEPKPVRSWAALKTKIVPPAYRAPSRMALAG